MRGSQYRRRQISPTPVQPGPNQTRTRFPHLSRRLFKELDEMATKMGSLAPAPSRRHAAARTRRALLALLLCLKGANAQQGPPSADFEDSCARVCGAFEACIVYEGAEYCAPYCAPGRCDDATEACVIQGRASCAHAPCLPVAVCEPLSTQLSSASTSEIIIDDSGLPANATCARSCPLVQTPVCGSDGISYANECFFQQAQCRTPSLTVDSLGLCASDLAFNAQYNPSPSPSPSHPTCDAIVCATVDDPVCSTNGTMRNMCYLQRAQCVDASIQLLRRVACEDGDALMPVCPTSCTQAFVPVCASNGAIYGNECLFRQAKCARSEYGELQARDLTECEMQIGDSDGQTSDVAAILAATVT